MVLETSIGDGDENVPTNVALEILFDETIDFESLSGVKLFENGIEKRVQRYDLTEGGKIVRIYLDNYEFLKPLTDYSLEVSGIKDLSGNELLSPVVINFKSGENPNIYAPNYQSSVPRFGDKSALVDGDIKFLFDAPLNRVRMLLQPIYLVNEDTAEKIETDVSVTNGNILVVSPREDLQLLSPGTTPYFIKTIDDMDVDVLPLTGPYGTWSISTESQEPVDAIDFLRWNLPDGFAQAPLNTKVVITFTKKLDFISCPIQDVVDFSDSLGNKVAFSFDIDDLSNRQSFFLGGEQLKLMPTGGLNPNTSYTVKVANYCDYSGNVNASESTLNFTTGNFEDTDTPKILSINPDSGAKGVDVNSPVVLTFSEPVSVEFNIEDSIYLYAGTTSNKLAGSYRWNADRSILTIVPNNPLPEETQISTYIPVGAFFIDFAGNTIGGAKLFRFTTNIAPPSL